MDKGRRIKWVMAAGICLALLMGCGAAHEQEDAAVEEELSQENVSAGLSAPGSAEPSAPEEGASSVELQAEKPAGEGHETDSTGYLVQGGASLPSEELSEQEPSASGQSAQEPSA